MRKSLLTLAVLSTFAAPSVVLAQATPAAAPASPHTIAGNVGLVSDYRFRGISQTFGKPAIQGGIDYSHSSGLYLGNWNSNVNEGAGFPAGNIEMDFYGGWKTTFGDFGLDVGFIYYAYPGSDANTTAGTSFTNPKNGKVHSGKVDNKELYVGGTWKFLSLKYYHSVGDYFSLPDTKGSNYIDFGANYEMGGGWTLVGHVGKFKLKNWEAGTDASKGNYVDYKIGVTKDLSGWLLGAAYVGANGKGSCDMANPGFYCFANQIPNGGIGSGTASFKDAGKGTVVFSAAKTF